jgi:hypothetical protein
MAGNLPVVNVFTSRQGEFLKMIIATEVTEISFSIQRKNVLLLFRSRLATIALAAVVMGAVGFTEAAQAQSSSLEISYARSLKNSVKTAKVVKNRKLAIKASFLGRAPFVCTPSGFGQKSSCFAR